VRGEALSIKDAPNHVPIGLVGDVVVRRKIERGQMIEFDDLEIKESKAYCAWEYTVDLV
jgi:predicted homoserine dehydrogenase-like protein